MAMSNFSINSSEYFSIAGINAFFINNTRKDVLRSRAVQVLAFNLADVEKRFKNNKGRTAYPDPGIRQRNKRPDKIQFGSRRFDFLYIENKLFQRSRARIRQILGTLFEARSILRKGI